MKNDAVSEYFRNADPVMFVLMERVGHPRPKSGKDHIVSLMESVVCQQLSAKAGTTIWNRFSSLFGGNVNPQDVMDVDPGKIRECGISWSKVGYIKNIAAAVAGGTLTPERFPEMSDDAIMRQLRAIKGVGPWTVEMFMMFSLGRPDVFSPGDVGLRRAMDKLYGAPGKRLSDAAVKRISGRWSPYRTSACLALWRSLDNA